MMPTYLTHDDLLKGCREFERHEHRDAMYRVAQHLIKEFWPRPEDVADALGVLLLTWNQAFYRYGPFDFAALQAFLNARKTELDRLRQRDILTFAAADEVLVDALFRECLDALQIVPPSRLAGRRSPVAASKALHLISPDFMPLWDDRIAKGYGCSWGSPDHGPAAYVAFMGKTRGIVESLSAQVPLPDLLADLCGQARFPKSLLKFLDEYNYAKFTQGWV